MVNTTETYPGKARVKPVLTIDTQKKIEEIAKKPVEEMTDPLRPCGALKWIQKMETFLELQGRKKFDENFHSTVEDDALPSQLIGMGSVKPAPSYQGIWMEHHAWG